MNDIDTKNPIVVLGTGRSGTSVVAGMLFYMGVHMGDEFIPADENNPTGHWEDKEFTHLNREVLTGKMDQGAWKIHVKDLIAKRQNQALYQGVRWGCKLPEATNLLDEYEAIFSELGIRAQYVVCRRDTEQVIQSCLRSYGKDRKTWEKLILNRVEIIEKKLINNSERQVLIEDLEDLVKTPATFVGNMVEYLGINPSNEQKLDATMLVNQEDKKAMVMVAVPNMGSIVTELALRLVQWSQEMGDRMAIYTPQNISPVDSARNTIINTFLEQKQFTHLFMIDADTVPQPFAMKALLRSNKDIITGVTPTFKIDPETKLVKSTPMVFKRKDQNSDVMFNVEGQGVQKIDATGGSCLMIKRSVIEKLPKPLFKFVYHDSGIVKQGEDLYFSKLLRDEGVQLYCNFDVVNYHRKEIIL